MEGNIFSAPQGALSAFPVVILIFVLLLIVIVALLVERSKFRAAQSNVRFITQLRRAELFDFLHKFNVLLDTLAGKKVISQDERRILLKLSQNFKTAVENGFNAVSTMDTRFERLLASFHGTSYVGGDWNRYKTDMIDISREYIALLKVCLAEQTATYGALVDAIRDLPVPDHQPSRRALSPCCAATFICA
eukprot:m.17163 g.17163  ORF g.17163 m.17163 type:complete len:191 (+) comp3215_c0_seq1:64-636(+)